jgi:hypothetical protein
MTKPVGANKNIYNRQVSKRDFVISLISLLLALLICFSLIRTTLLDKVQVGTVSDAEVTVLIFVFFITAVFFVLMKAALWIIGI